MKEFENFENFRKYHSRNYFPDRVCPGLRCRNQQFPSYTVSPNSHFRLKLQDSSKGTILPQPGLDKTLDREEQPEIRLTLQALDGGIPPKSGTADQTSVIMPPSLHSCTMRCKSQNTAPLDSRLPSSLPEIQILEPMEKYLMYFRKHLKISAKHFK